MAYHIALPLCPEGIWGMNVVYSKIYGLFIINSFQRDKIYNLPFSIEDEQDWKWEHVATMKNNKYYTNSIVLNDHKLFICTGRANGFNYKTVDILNLKGGNYVFEAVKDMHLARQSPGIYNHKEMNQIFVGGGSGSADVEYYDLHKQEWYLLGTQTIGTYKRYPILWTDNNDYNILSIAGGDSRGFMESMDLREGKKWKIVKSGDLWKDFFGATYVTDHSWLAC